MVRNRSGELVSVASMASLTREEGVNNIRHFGLNRAIRDHGHPRANGQQR